MDCEFPTALGGTPSTPAPAPNPGEYSCPSGHQPPQFLLWMPQFIGFSSVEAGWGWVSLMELKKAQKHKHCLLSSDHYSYTMES